MGHMQDFLFIFFPIFLYACVKLHLSRKKSSLSTSAPIKSILLAYRTAEMPISRCASAVLYLHQPQSKEGNPICDQTDPDKREASSRYHLPLSHTDLQSRISCAYHFLYPALPRQLRTPDSGGSHRARLATHCIVLMARNQEENRTCQDAH